MSRKECLCLYLCCVVWGMKRGMEKGKKEKKRMNEMEGRVGQEEEEEVGLDVYDINRQAVQQGNSGVVGQWDNGPFLCWSCLASVEI